MEKDSKPQAFTEVAHGALAAPPYTYPSTPEGLKAESICLPQKSYIGGGRSAEELDCASALL